MLTAWCRPLATARPVCLFEVREFGMTSLRRLVPIEIDQISNDDEIGAVTVPHRAGNRGKPCIIRAILVIS